MSISESQATADKNGSYPRRLLALLASATFFEGFDAAIPAVVLPDLADSFGISSENTAALGGPIFAVGLGAFGGLFVTMMGDRIGRKPLLIATTALYAFFTGLTATSQTLGAFVAYQFLARMFLAAELAIAVTMVTEEFPAARRGRAVGTLVAAGAFGLPVVAGLHFLVQDTALGWRWLYIVGLAPLLLVAILRTGLRETSRWQEARATPRRRGLIRRNYGRQILQIGLVFFLTHAALLAGLTWWRWYAQNERGLDDGTVTVMLTAGYLVGISGYFAAGYLQDRIGRRATGVIFLLAGATLGISVFQVSNATLMLPLLALAVFFAVGVSPVTSAMAAELFPTEVRATAVAITRSVFGTLGAISGPLAVAFMADARFGLIPSVGDSVSLIALLYLPAAIVLALLPETAGRDLESISASGEIPAPTGEFAYAPPRVTLPDAPGRSYESDDPTAN